MNRNFDYEIDFGKTINIEKKFNNYKAFFQKAVTDSSLYQLQKNKSEIYATSGVHKIKGVMEKDNIAVGWISEQQKLLR